MSLVFYFYSKAEQDPPYHLLTQTGLDCRKNSAWPKKIHINSVNVIYMVFGGLCLGYFQKTKLRTAKKWITYIDSFYKNRCSHRKFFIFFNFQSPCSELKQNLLQIN